MEARSQLRHRPAWAAQSDSNIYQWNSATSAPQRFAIRHPREFGRYMRNLSVSKCETIVDNKILEIPTGELI